ncbi:MAG: NAD(P)H-dependent oxidoreductase subunit E [Bacteroidota bacterium]
MIARYPAGRQKSAVLPVLHVAQAEWGWCSVPVMDYVASLLDIKPIEVYEVASFYTMFHLQKTGRHVMEVCRTGPCCLLGAEDLLDYLKKKLDIGIGGTSADGKFTLKTVECLAACGFAPVMQIREQYYERLSPEKLDKIMEELP